MAFKIPCCFRSGITNYLGGIKFTCLSCMWNCNWARDENDSVHSLQRKQQPSSWTLLASGHSIILNRCIYLANFWNLQNINLHIIKLRILKKSMEKNYILINDVELTDLYKSITSPKRMQLGLQPDIRLDLDLKVDLVDKVLWAHGYLQLDLGSCSN